MSYACSLIAPRVSWLLNVFHLGVLVDKRGGIVRLGDPAASTFMLSSHLSCSTGISDRSSSHTLLRELEREKVWSRIHLVPLIVAEGDRAAYHRRQADVAMEKAIMKDVPGWEVSSLFHNYMTRCGD